jgi:cell division protease FtsH
MVTKYGMSDEIGLVALTDHEILSLNKDFSNPINQAIKNIIDECNKKAEETLQKNIKLLHTVAIELKDKETLSGEEFRELVKSHN